ncbi:MAG: helix-turn-helix transcriptional regulator, partial [Clostridiales Family XIII bacterium]|nr:helix-turn-helix transcriptional regulator [Clostridiales Family XIII bacterium]
MNKAKNKRCPIEYTLSLISGKWKILILKELSQGALRYGVIGKRIPEISPKVLISHLREMEEDGLIVREVFPEVPPRVEYS